MSTAASSPWPFLVLSPLTEATGHLLRDDAFWFANLSAVDPETTIVTSAASATALRRQFPTGAERCREFRDVLWAKRLGFRVYLALRLLSLPPIWRRRVVIQAFEEVSLLLYLLRLRRHENHVGLVLTNNVSPERIARRPRILAFLLREIFKRVDVVFYHSDFELSLIRNLLGPDLPTVRFAKLKYHLIGEARRRPDGGQTSGAVVTFFGPASDSKPLEAIFPLIAADRARDFSYSFVNLSAEHAEALRRQFPENDNLTFVNRYLGDAEYQGIIQASRFVFLPHNRFYEGKVSGILSDCIANGVPVISDAIEPVLEMCRSYEPIGCVFSYDIETDWAGRLRVMRSIEAHAQFQVALRRCCESHAPQIILREFLAASSMMEVVTEAECLRVQHQLCHANNSGSVASSDVVL